MNNVILIGRITKDLEIRYTPKEQTAITTFNIAIGREGSEGTDYPKVTVFGRQAENCVKYLKKGSRVAVSGRIQTDSYTNKDGKKVYTTDVIAHRVEFIDFSQNEPVNEAQDDGYLKLNDDIPF